LIFAATASEANLLISVIIAERVSLSRFSPRFFPNSFLLRFLKESCKITYMRAEGLGEQND
jgi:hypothetical protein